MTSLPHELMAMHRIASAVAKANSEYASTASVLESISNMASQKRLHRELPQDILGRAAQYILDISGCKAEQKKFALLAEPRMKKA